MRLSGQVVLVTGGGAGIGAALCRRIAAERPAGIVIADLDGAAARALAAELGSVALGLRCDAADEADLRTALDAAHGAFGAPVGACFANAGIAVGSDEQTADEIWDLAFDVNVRSHILAARLLVPGWLERGSGCFVATASAAGLLTQLGCAPYTVTKHAVVGFAEWLAVTYGDRGIHVSCLCPQGVKTAMTQGAEADDAPALRAAGVEAVKAAGELLEPEQVAEDVIRGLDEERFLILPHPEVLDYVRRKAADEDRWIAGMQRLRRSVAGA